MFTRLIRLTTSWGENYVFQPVRQVPRNRSHRLLNLIQLGVLLARREAEAHYLQVDFLIIMRVGNSKGLGDPGVKGILLKLAHPRHDTHGTGRK